MQMSMLLPANIAGSLEDRKLSLQLRPMIGGGRTGRFGGGGLLGCDTQNSILRLLSIALDSGAGHDGEDKVQIEQCLQGSNRTVLARLQCCSS